MTTVFCRIVGGGVGVENINITPNDSWVIASTCEPLELPR